MEGGREGKKRDLVQLMAVVEAPLEHGSTTTTESVEQLGAELHASGNEGGGGRHMHTASRLVEFPAPPGKGTG